MLKTAFVKWLLFFLCLHITPYIHAQKHDKENNQFVTFIVNPQRDELKFYWKDDQQKNLRSLQRLKTWLENKQSKLLFATNGGMYNADNSPKGLYIENGITLNPLDTINGNGNFYLKPNGVFYITRDNDPVICVTQEFNKYNVKYATQSGPMLIINGDIHPAFRQGSTNLNIRNGVGILPDNQVVFVMSKKEINFYDFASYFKSIGCLNALYLDGFVSRTYLPEKSWIQTDGDFGIIIGVTQHLKSTIR